MFLIFSDMMKLEFAQENIVEALLDIADKYVKPVQPQASFDQEFDVGKVATDIIVLLLTGGEYGFLQHLTFCI